MARLAQTSIRFRDFEIDEDRLNQLGTQIDGAAAKVAREIYGQGVEIDVVLEAGSLLIRTTVIGALLLGGYDAVSKYSDFKEGVGELVQDAQHYGSAIYNEVLKLIGERKAESVAIRDMTPGKIARVIERLEKLQQVEKHAPSRLVQEELRRIARDVQAIERDLQPQEKQFVQKQLHLEGLPPLHKLPEPRPGREEEARIGVVRKQKDRIDRPYSDRRKRLRYHNHFEI
jgi:hypothetical protein